MFDEIQSMVFTQMQQTSFIRYKASLKEGKKFTKFRGARVGDINMERQSPKDSRKAPQGT